MRLRHDRVARELTANTTTVDAFAQNTVTSEAVPGLVLVHTALAVAFYVGGAAATVKATFTQQFFIHVSTSSRGQS